MIFHGINPFPLWENLKNYHTIRFRSDLVAALNVALLALPQAMAYAFVAELPASAGIWAAIFGTIFTASFGDSRFLISGPTNTIAIMIQSGVSEILSTYYSEVAGEQREILALNIVLQLVFVIGVFQIAASLFRLGRLSQFASRSVIIGYMAAAGFVIVVNQLFPFFGLQEPEGYRPIYQQAWYFLSHFFLLKPTTTAFAVVSMTLLFFLHRYSQKIPAAALVFLLASVTMIIFKISSVPILQDVLYIDITVPTFTLPELDLKILGKLIPLAFAITMMSVMEATAIGRSYATSKEPSYQDNQEIYGLGISNLFSSFLGGMPSSGSFSRSSLNFVSGAKTRLAAIFSGFFVYLMTSIFSDWVGKIPLASLGALLILTAYTMVNFRELTLCLKATRSDALVVIVTFFASWFFTLDVVLYIGIALSIALYLKKAAIPYLIEYTFNPLGKLRPISEEASRLDPRIAIFQAEGELFFAAAEPLQTKLHHIAEDEHIKIVILQLFNTRYLDASVCLALEKIYHYLKHTGRYFILTGISESVWHVLEKTNLITLLGKEHCFPAHTQLPGEPTREAYAYAKELLSNNYFFKQS